MIGFSSWLVRPLCGLILGLLVTVPAVAEGGPAAPQAVPAEAHRTIGEVFRDLNWERPVPAMTRFQLAPGERPFAGITKVVFLHCPEAPLVHRHWVVADRTGIHLVNARGEVRHLAGVNPESKGEAGEFSCLALAARPAGSHEQNPYALAWAQENPVSPEGVVSCSVHALGTDGMTRKIASGLVVARPGMDMPLSWARFAEIKAMAMDRRGRLFLVDTSTQTIKVIERNGDVTLLAGDRKGCTAKDGFGCKAAFASLQGMALDLDTGSLYVTDRHSVRRVKPDGEVTTLFGRFDTHGKGFATGTWPVGGDSACLHYPRGLELRGGHLYLADTFNCAVRVFDLDSARLYTLAGHPEQKETREGPLSHFSPERPRTACAALGHPVDIAFNPEGVCLVALDDSLVELDFPLFEPAEPTETTGTECMGKPPCVIL